MAVKANLGNNLTEIVVGVITLITNAIKIVEKLIVFIKYKVSKLEVFRVIIAVAGRARKGIKIIRQQR